MRDTYAMIDLKSKYGTLEVYFCFTLRPLDSCTDTWWIGSVSHHFLHNCDIFLVQKCFDRNGRGVFDRLIHTHFDQLRPSLSPRTFEILVQLTRLLLLINLTPIAFFFLPTSLLPENIIFD